MRACHWLGRSMWQQVGFLSARCVACMIFLWQLPPESFRWAFRPLGNRSIVSVSPMVTVLPLSYTFAISNEGGCFVSAFYLTLLAFARHPLHHGEGLATRKCALTVQRYDAEKTICKSGFRHGGAAPPMRGIVRFEAEQIACGGYRFMLANFFFCLV